MKVVGWIQSERGERKKYGGGGSRREIADKAERRKWEKKLAGGKERVFGMGHK